MPCLSNLRTSAIYQFNALHKWPNPRFLRLAEKDYYSAVSFLRQIGRDRW